METFSMSKSGKITRLALLFGYVLFISICGAVLLVTTEGVWGLIGLLAVVGAIGMLITFVVTLVSNPKLTIDEYGVELSGYKISNWNKRLAWKGITQAKITGSNKSPILNLTSNAESIVIEGKEWNELNFDNIVNVIASNLATNGVKILDTR